MSDKTIQKGSVQADDKFHITVTAHGPYLVFGMPPLKQQFIMPDEEGEAWFFQEGRSFPMDQELVALCRCGASKNKPYCDGSHARAEWDDRLTASERPLLEGAELTEGPEISLSDNNAFCVYARFCDARGRVWNLVGQSDDPEAGKVAVREACHCPNSRLIAWDNSSHRPIEPKFEPSLGLIEDPQIDCSGGLWVRGGIPVSREDGFTYEVRNRTVLCRCGASSNKPYCDGSHASLKFRDGLGGEPDGEKW